MNVLILLLWAGYGLLILFSSVSMNGPNMFGMVLLTAILLFFDKGCTVSYGPVSDPQVIRIGGDVIEGSEKAPSDLPVLPNPLEGEEVLLQHVE
jgi:hypothetical protein